MEDVTNKLSEIENQVSGIKDPILRKIAFERLLDLSFSDPKTKKSSLTTISNIPKRSKGKKSQGNIYYYESQIRPDIVEMKVAGILKDFPNFKDCGSKINTYLWVLAYAKTQNIDGMTIHEIAYILSKKLYKPTKYTTVYGIRNKVGDGVVVQEPETDHWRITPEGEDYLKNLNKKES